MRLLETLLLLANLLTFLALIVPLQDAARWTGYLALIGLLLAVLQMLAEGPRWQLFPAYGLAALFFLVWLLPGVAGIAPALRFTSGLVVGAGIVLGALALGASITLPLILPVLRFPQPTGPYGIGTLAYHWVDASRQELFVADREARRELMVQIWYPADRDPAAPRAPYVQQAVTPALARASHLPSFTYGHWKYITTNSVASAPVAGDTLTYPVIFFLEGLTGFRQHNTFQVEELVSQGFIVAALDQPYTAGAVLFPDGRETEGLDAKRWAPLWQQSIRPGESTPVLNGHALEDGIIPYLAQDAVFALDQLTGLNEADPNGILTGRLDLQRSGLIGVSLGAIVGAEACLREPRFRACLLMEAPMPADVVRAGLQQPAMWITTDAGTMRREGWPEEEIAAHLGTMRTVFESLPAAGYFVQIQGLFHLNLTDFPLLWSPATSRLGLTGPIAARRAHGIINAYSAAFFDRHLSDLPAALLDGPAGQYPEVHYAMRRP